MAIIPQGYSPGLIVGEYTEGVCGVFGRILFFPSRVFGDLRKQTIRFKTRQIKPRHKPELRLLVSERK